MCHLRKQSPAEQSAGTVRLSHTAWLTGMLFLLFAGLFWLGYLSGGFSRNTVSAGWENSSFHSADHCIFPVCGKPRRGVLQSAYSAEIRFASTRRSCLLTVFP